MRLSYIIQIQIKMALVGIILAVIAGDVTPDTNKIFFTSTRNESMLASSSSEKGASPAVPRSKELEDFCQSSIFINLDLKKPIYRFIQAMLKLNDEQFDVIIEKHRSIIDFMVISNKNFYCSYYNNLIEYAEMCEIGKEMDDNIAFLAGIVEIQELEEKKIIINQGFWIILQASLVFLLTYFVAKVYKSREELNFFTRRATVEVDSASPNSPFALDSDDYQADVVSFNGSGNFRRASYRSED